MYQQLLQQISKISESKPRHTKLLTSLQDFTAEQTVEFFTELQTHVKNSNPDFLSIHLDFVVHDEWMTLFGKSKLKKMYSTCLTQGNFILAGAFDTRMVVGSENGSIPDSAKLALSKLTLGERKQLSRLSDRRKLDYLMYDSDPTVIAQILNNPRIIERDVLKMINQALRTSLLLKKVYQHSKWIRLKSVQKALLCHESLPSFIFALLVHHMAKQDLPLIKERIVKHENKTLWIDFLLTKDHLGN